MDFSHIPQSFAALGSAFYARLDAQPLAAAHWVAHSHAMARELGLSDEWMQSNEALAVLTGNARAKGSQPLASVYSGHQFGVWAGQLGDGRALLLGELSSPDGKPWDIQLKGAGPTPYSRMGDGRAVLRSSIREFLCSEAMHGLGIPTTRALAVTGSPQPVRREDIETAAVVTRCAPSFIRFGHFEHFSYLGQHAQLKALADHVIQRFYTECQEAKNPYTALLEAVSARTAQLIAQWQAVGFCHGVMNTDNMSILGLTIDYGPFQFLDTFNPAHICNHSDGHGRYAYDKQPNVAYWNLFCLGQALMPLIRAIESHDDAAQEAALGALEPYKSIFPNTLQARMAAKLGFAQAHEGQRELIESILKLLAADHVDYTIFWRRLSHARALGDDSSVRDLFVNRQACDDWLLLLNEHSRIIPCGQDSHLMLKSNPAYVLRNHLGELAIQAAKQHDFSEVKRLHRVLENPYAEQPGMDSYASFAPDWATSLEISCSS